MFWKSLGKPFLHIYTDGSLKNHVGAWAYIVVKNQKIIAENYNRSEYSDCNQLELQAAIEVLKTFTTPIAATLYSDSRILIDTMTLWIADWKKQNWLKANGRSIPYVEQIKILDLLNQMHSIEWKWIRSHSGHIFNDRVDELCARIHAQNSNPQVDFLEGNK